MSADTTPTPEGWERRGPCFIREHGGKLAVIDPHPTQDSWWCVLHERGESDRDTGIYLPLSDAINWANDQLGVPKPVVVHEREFGDGSVLVWREDGKASARVSQYQGSSLWYIDGLDEDRGARESAVSAAREYVRGVQ
jgi:hypothetical protein